jgi:hypothetical protein
VVVTFPDEHILERRIRQLHRLPWVLPASLIMQMREEDFDALDEAPNEAVWWGILNVIVTRITDTDKEEAA